MELPVESLSMPRLREDLLSCPHSLEEWNEAYRRVEAYFSALRVENKLLLSSLVLKILVKASDRLEEEPDRSAVELAAEETDRTLVEWFRQVLGRAEAEPYDRLSAQGRLALLQVERDVPWQRYFLSDEPLPAEYVKLMQTAYLHADPDFSFVEMRPRPIDLGIVHTATRTMEKIGRRRRVATAIFWILSAVIITGIFFATR